MPRRTLFPSKPDEIQSLARIIAAVCIYEPANGARLERDFEAYAQIATGRLYTILSFIADTAFAEHEDAFVRFASWHTLYDNKNPSLDRDLVREIVAREF